MKKDKFPDRNSYIGPSEASMACGLSAYGDPVELWQVKTGRRARLRTTPIMERGNMMEPVIINRLINDHGLDLYGFQEELQDLDRPWFRGHNDAFIREYHYVGAGFPADNMVGEGIAEIKAPGSRMVQKFAKEGLSPDYILQTQLYMHLTGAQWCSVFYLDYDSNVIEQVDMVRDDSFIRAALVQVDNFWQHVEKDTEPPMITPELDFPELDDTTVLNVHENGMPQRMMVLREYAKALGQQAELKETLRICEQQIKKTMIHEKVGAMTSEVINITWKEQERRTTQAKELNDWTEQLCLAVESKNEKVVQQMVNVYLNDPDLFAKVTKSRTFRKKVL